MLVIFWYFILFLRIKNINFFSISSLISIYIFLIISGRLPLPISSFEIELWMIFGLIFIAINIYFIGSVLEYLQEFVNRDSNRSVYKFLSFIFIISSFLFASYGFLAFNSYADGYYLLMIEIFSIAIILTLFNIDKYKSKFRKIIFTSILSSTVLVGIIGLIAQIFIFIGLFDCNSLSIFHPLGDIHCIGFLNSSIYRFSIGSNINEFSLYILISLIILINNPNILLENKINNFSLIFTHKFYNFIRLFLILILFLSLSRSATLGLFIFLLIKFNNSFISSLSSLSFKVNTKNFYRDIKLALFILFISLLIYYQKDIYNVLKYLIESRFSFFLNPSLLFEGSSSESRLQNIEDYDYLLKNFNLLPIIPLGQATGFHNTFLQFFLEYGLLPASIGLILLMKIALRKASYVIPIYLFMVAHHVLYNPIVWIYLASISMLDNNRESTNF